MALYLKLIHQNKPNKSSVCLIRLLCAQFRSFDWLKLNLKNSVFVLKENLYDPRSSKEFYLNGINLADTMESNRPSHNAFNSSSKRILHRDDDLVPFTANLASPSAHELFKYSTKSVPKRHVASHQANNLEDNFYSSSKMSKMIEENSAEMNRPLSRKVANFKYRGIWPFISFFYGFNWLKIWNKPI